MIFPKPLPGTEDKISFNGWQLEADISEAVASIMKEAITNTLCSGDFMEQMEVEFMYGLPDFTIGVSLPFTGADRDDSDERPTWVFTLHDLTDEWLGDERDEERPQEYIDRTFRLALAFEAEARLLRAAATAMKPE